MSILFQVAPRRVLVPAIHRSTIVKSISRRSMMSFGEKARLKVRDVYISYYVSDNYLEKPINQPTTKTYSLTSFIIFGGFIQSQSYSHSHSHSR
mmetsp:Transcript_25611/g.26008  ORF Transcript_25611/g.26008 Transcript_25611/m.26008 type:complete len:94 (+) Transcript_25611:243-524(+)